MPDCSPASGATVMPFRFFLGYLILVISSIGTGVVTIAINTIAADITESISTVEFFSH